MFFAFITHIALYTILTYRISFKSERTDGRRTYGRILRSALLGRFA